jgi:hypothetical protein
MHVHCNRLCYAPYQLFKKCGIQGPPPAVFVGNYNEIKKKVHAGLFVPRKLSGIPPEQNPNWVLINEL